MPNRSFKHIMRQNIYRQILYLKVLTIFIVLKRINALIIQQNFSYLLGTLPYMRVVTGAKYSSLPDNLRHKLSFNVTKDIFDQELGTPINITKSLPELAGKKITLSYSPATQADENVINSYSMNKSMFPAYLINLRPVLKIDGNIVATGTEITMGLSEEFKMTFSGPEPNANDVIINVIQAGEYLGIALNLSKISGKQMADLKTKIASTKAKIDMHDYINLTKEDILGDLLYATALSYHMELDFIKHLAQKTSGVIAVTLPSETLFSFEIEVKSFFGSPLSASSQGLSMDADRLMTLVKALDADNEKSKQFLLTTGMSSSALEHSVPEQLFSTPDNPAHGVSAVKALQIANEQGIPVYTINQSNINSILPQLQLDAATIDDIKNAINTGKVVTVSKADISYDGWTGNGYIIIDPISGAGAYMISGAVNGGFLVKSLQWFLSMMRDSEVLSTINYIAGLAGQYGAVITVFTLFFTMADIWFNTNNTVDEKLCAIAATCLSQVLLFLLGLATSKDPAVFMATILMGFLVDILTNVFINAQCGGIEYTENSSRLFRNINRRVIYEFS